MDWTCFSFVSHTCSIGLKSVEFKGQNNNLKPKNPLHLSVILILDSYFIFFAPISKTCSSIVEYASCCIDKDIHTLVTLLGFSCHWSVLSVIFPTAADITVASYWWVWREGVGGGNWLWNMARITQTEKRKEGKNESNRNGGRMYLLLCCKKGLAGMITGES